jgi:hypothetical protein
MKLYGQNLNNSQTSLKEDRAGWLNAKAKTKDFQIVLLTADNKSLYKNENHCSLKQFCGIMQSAFHVFKPQML